MAKRFTLGEFEEIILLTVAAMDGTGYGVSIMREIVLQTSRPTRLNQVHESLGRLENKGMITSRLGDPTPERGGRRKRIFTITAYGMQILREIQSVRNNLWSSLSPALRLTDI